jgi:hypothetical protein
MRVTALDGRWFADDLFVDASLLMPDVPEFMFF